MSTFLDESQTYIKTVYDGFDSTAIKSVTLVSKMVTECIVVFNSSDKEYNYTVNDNSFEENLQNTIMNGESVGKFITSSIKSDKIQQINTIVQ